MNGYKATAISSSPALALVLSSWFCLLSALQLLMLALIIELNPSPRTEKPSIPKHLGLAWSVPMPTFTY
jgi:hypothetical protein